jgi:hypothetical protein
MQAKGQSAQADAHAAEVVVVANDRPMHDTRKYKINDSRTLPTGTVSTWYQTLKITVISAYFCGCENQLSVMMFGLFKFCVSPTSEATLALTRGLVKGTAWDCLIGASLGCGRNVFC